MQNETWNCLDLITIDFPLKTSSWWQYLSLYNPNICLHVNGTIAHIPVTHAIYTDEPPYHDRRFASVAGESLDSPFGLWDWEFNVRFSQEQAETWTHLTTAHISTVYLTI